MRRRRTILLAVLVFLLAAAALWSCGYVADRRRSALTAAESLQECRNLAGTIERIRRRPRKADDAERLSTETTGRIEKAARSAGIAGDRLLRITPEPPQRLGDTVYKEKPTQVLLKNVTLKQLTWFVHALTSGADPLHARSIRLAAPRREDTSQSWSAEIALTYLIYDPPHMKD